MLRNRIMNVEQFVKAFATYSDNFKVFKNSHIEYLKSRDPNFDLEEYEERHKKNIEQRQMLLEKFAKETDPEKRLRESTWMIVFEHFVRTIEKKEI